MRSRNMIMLATMCVIFGGMLAINTRAQKLDKPLYIQAQAMGEQQQLGRTFNMTLIIEEWSTADDQKALMGAFAEKQNEGLVNALTKMHRKGRISITGTLGYEVAYARQFPQPDGTTKIRIVTDRPITFGEAWSDSRSMDYNLSGVELILTPDKKKSSGTLAPACQLKLNKEGHIELQLYQNPWKLVDVQQR